MPVAFTGENLKPWKMFLNHVHGSYGRLASLIFFSYPLSWPEPSLSFETSVGDSRAVAILYQLWINLDLFSWIRPLMVPLKAVALLYRLLTGTGGVKGVVVSRRALPLWECSMWTAKWQSDLTEKCYLPGCVELGHCFATLPLWSLFHGGSSFSHSLCAAP